MLASVVGRPGERIGGVAGRLARRNAMRNPGRTAATAAALTIGVTLVVLVAAVGQGLRDVSTGAVEKAVRADYVVGPTDGWSPITPAAGAAVRSVAGVRLASSITQDEARVFGTKEGVNGINAATIGRLYRFDWREGSDASLARLGSDGALVDSTFAKTHRLHVGSRFAVTPPSGRSFKVVVRGVTVTPKLNPMQLGAINVSSAVFARAFAAQRERFTLVDAGPEAGAAMRARLAAFPDAELQTRSEFAHLQLSFIDSIMAIFYALLALAVIVSLFGIVNTLALSVLERTRELGVLRAIGMTRRQVRRMVRHESIVTALVGATMGVAAGLALAALVTTLLKDEGFRFAFPAGPIAVFAVIAVLAGIAAAILPARRAARLEPLAALQYE
jgi:putative ABC transport system permease protein